MSGDKIKVMIVEDEILTAKYLQMELQDWGFEVPKPAAKGEDAVRIALQEHPFIILMDIRLAGGMDGIEAAEEITLHQDIPIVFMTGYDLDYIRERAVKITSASFLTKPVDTFAIRQIIDTLKMTAFENSVC
jgi:CheY-like chemotaxis protein